MSLIKINKYFKKPDIVLFIPPRIIVGRYVNNYYRTKNYCHTNNNNVDVLRNSIRSFPKYYHTHPLEARLFTLFDLSLKSIGPRL